MNRQISFNFQFSSEFLSFHFMLERKSDLANVFIGFWRSREDARLGGLGPREEHLVKNRVDLAIVPYLSTIPSEAKPLPRAQHAPYKS